MKVLLIRPPDENSLEAELPQAIQQENVSYPPLGLLYVASSINREGKDHAIIYDGQMEPDGFRGLAKMIEEVAPDVAGITTFSHSLRDVIRCVELLSSSPSVQKIILGGPHARDFPLKALSLPGVDMVIAGEGETRILTLLDSIREGKAIPRDDGIYIKGYEVRETGLTQAPPTMKNLDEYPFPDRTLIKYRNYLDIFSGRVFSTMAGSRGCPYRCTFCNTPRIGYRARSPKNIIDEVEECLALGINEIYFVDDTFNVRPSHVIEFCDEIIKRGVEFSWTIRARVRGMNRHILRNLKRAGCHRIQFGVESGNEIVLKRLKKDVNKNEINEVFEMARKAGIETVAYFMIGCPGEEGWDGVMETIDYSIRLSPDYAMYNILVPFPGTPLFEEGVRAGILKEEGWMKYFESPYTPFTPPFWEERLTARELFSLLHIAYKRFYMRPSKVFKNLREIKKLDELKRKARVGLRLLFKT